jgi:preprotein translocase subunit YajC
MFITQAFAQAADAAAPAGLGGLGGIAQFAPLVLIFVVFYFLLIRPQQKKMKAHRAMVSALKRGDRVVTSGGIVGTVTKVMSDTEVQIEIAENVRVRVVRSSITDILAKTEPAANGNTKEETAKGE